MHSPCCRAALGKKNSALALTLWAAGISLSTMVNLDGYNGWRRGGSTLMVWTILVAKTSYLAVYMRCYCILTSTLVMVIKVALTFVGDQIPRI